jgi:hypothetical protein
MTFSQMKSWFRSVRAGANLDEAKRDARLGLEEVESEDDYHRRLYEHEKKKALQYRTHENHQHAHIVNHIHRHHKSFKFTDSNLSVGSGQFVDQPASKYNSGSDSSYFSDSESDRDFDAGRRGVSYQFESEDPSSRGSSVDKSSPGRGSPGRGSPGRGGGGNVFHSQGWGNQQTSQQEDEDDGSQSNKERNRKGDSIEEGSTINVGDKVSCLYVPENMWYPAVIIDINISDDNGGIEFDIQYDGFDGADAFEYGKPAREVSANNSKDDGLGAISEEEECD